MNLMAQCRFSLFLLAFFCFFGVLNASPGDSDPIYKTCVEQCEKTGCVGNKCFQHCNFSSDGNPIDGPWYLQEPLYMRWKQWDCRSDCRYECMLSREEERRKLGNKPTKYHGRWPLRRIYGIQEPVSVALSALNLAVQFHGWVSFFILVNYKLPFRPNKSTFYEYTGMWHLYAIFAMNTWFWSAVFHSQDVELTEKLDYSSGVALLGYSLILATIRAFNVRLEAARVMVAAPIIAFTTTHILYLNFYQFDYGLNMIVCTIMGALQLILWAVWAGVTRHPSCFKLWVVVSGGAASMLLDIYDFPPYWGLVDAHVLSLATTIPLTYLWWSFARDDSEFRTSMLIKKTK
ncbi:post-GPI attachment to proteins factor 3-like isoform X1 [Olea europaea var. sylvestris]|nr:post-GPI attachment to proteins factor 3-like isoform X1 [Olea europaea var. sylvestris]